MAYQCFCEWKQGLSASARQSLGMAWSYPMSSRLDDSFRGGLQNSGRDHSGAQVYVPFPFSGPLKNKRGRAQCHTCPLVLIHEDNLAARKEGGYKNIQMMNFNMKNHRHPPPPPPSDTRDFHCHHYHFLFSTTFM